MSDPFVRSPLVARFIRYVQIDTTSDPESTSVPSSERQKNLGRLLVDELRALGIEDAVMDSHGYVFATIPARQARPGTPVVALLAHVDTASDAPGQGVKPVIHADYRGESIALPGDPAVRLDPQRSPALLDHIGHDLISSDGTTLLGSDDKAGVAVLMQLAADLINNNAVVRPTIRLCFTIDEEIGRGVDHLDLDRLGANVGYTIDGSGTDNISVETFNAAEARLAVKGVMVHPGYAKNVMVNAARILAEMLAELPDDQAPESTADREGYLHLLEIAGSTAAWAGAKIILRDFDDDELSRKKELLRNIVATSKQRHPGAEIELDIRDQYRNMRSYIEASDPRVISFAHAAAQEMGISLREEEVRGGTDGARLSELGLPTPNIFNGGHDYHSVFEWNTIQNMERSLAYVKQLMAYWARNGGETND